VEALPVKPPFKLGWADYALVALTCLMILFFFDRWSAPVQDWLKEITEPGPIPYDPAIDPASEPADDPGGAPAPDTPTGMEDRQ